MISPTVSIVRMSCVGLVRGDRYNSNREGDNSWSWDERGSEIRLGVIEKNH